MVAASSATMKRTAWLVGACVVVGMLACATPQGTGEGDASPGQAEVVSQELSALEVDNVDGDTVITLVGLEPPAADFDLDLDALAGQSARHVGGADRLFERRAPATARHR